MKCQYRTLIYYCFTSSTYLCFGTALARRSSLFIQSSSNRFVSLGMLATWLRLPPVCPSKARVNPGRLCSPTWKRPLNGCLPQSANTLAEAEGGSGAGAALRHGSLAGAGSASCLSPPYSVMWCLGHSMYTHSRQTRRGRAGEKLCIFLSVRDDCVLWCVYWLIVKKCRERPLHELPQKVGDYVFSTLLSLPLHGFDPVPFVIVPFLNLIIPPLLYPYLNLICPICFYSGSTMGSPPVQGAPSCILGSEGSCDVLTEVASHKGWHRVPPLHF